MKFKIQYRLTNSRDWFPIGEFYSTWIDSIDAMDNFKSRNDGRVADCRTVPVKGKW